MVYIYQEKYSVSDLNVLLRPLSFRYLRLSFAVEFREEYFREPESRTRSDAALTQVR
jgi:hypothetical protein